MQLDYQLGMMTQICIKTVCYMVISPIFWVTLWFTYRYYIKYEWDKASAGHIALASSLEGIGAGIFVIWLTTVLGLIIKPGVVLYMMGPVAMMLSLLRPRFLCLAYGAGVTLVLCTVFHIPVDVFGISGLVAILHLAEGILVLIFGGQHTVITYCRNKGEIEVRRGIYRFWPVPVCLIIAIQVKEVSFLNMPDWWPLLSNAAVSGGATLGLLPLTVSLGYSDLSGRVMEIDKRRVKNAILIICYAIMLLGLCLIAEKFSIGKWITIGWMVVGHEIIIFSPDLFIKN
ncbi:MAG: hypothetical protein IJN87_09110 [Firmicutes bacterium]|nr:hypothetical protein [Bacillota bacterium]